MNLKTKFNIGDDVYLIRYIYEESETSCSVCNGTGIVHIKEKGFLMRCSILYLIFIWLPASELTAPSDMRNKRITAGHTLAVICVSFLMDSAWRCVVYPWWVIIFAVEIVLIIITVLLVRKYL